MKVMVNKKEMEVAEGLTLDALMQQIQPEGGSFAVAVGMKVIKKDNWAATRLSENDDIMVIRATCGG